ncbi:MAG: histidine kinase [Micrococcales bacterium]|nr:histidine kinase [Micrococcales bacterium]
MRGASSETGGHEVSLSRLWHPMSRGRWAFSPADVLVVVLCIALDLVMSWGLTQPVRWGGSVPPGLFLVLVVVSAVPLLWRAVRPLGVFLVVVAASVALTTVFYQYQSIAAPLVAMFALVRRREDTMSRAALPLSTVPLAVGTYNATGLADRPNLGLFAVLYSVWLALAGLVYYLAVRERRTAREARLREQSIAADAVRALDDERSRIARDLHDILAHSISAMMLQSAGARALWQAELSAREGASPAGSIQEASEASGLAPAPDSRAEQIGAALSAIDSTGAQAMRELHRLLGLLRTQGSVEDEQVGYADPPGLTEIKRLVETTRESGLAVTVAETGTPGPLDPSVDLAAYRVVQECLANAMKHDGRGASVDLLLTRTQTHLDIQVRSHHGPEHEEQESGGFGLRGLRERVELAGGELASGPVDGTYVTTARLPVRAMAADTDPALRLRRISSGTEDHW